MLFGRRTSFRLGHFTVLQHGSDERRVFDLVRKKICITCSCPEEARETIWCRTPAGFLLRFDRGTYHSIPYSTPCSPWSFGKDFGGTTGDQNGAPVPRNLPLPVDQHRGILDRGAKGATEAKKCHGGAGGERKSGGSKQSRVPSEKKVTLANQEQQQQGSTTGVVNRIAPFQLTSSHDKRFKSLPPAEMLPRHETLGGYVFVCNNETMEEDLKLKLFGLPRRYLDSVRAIQPGIPLFLYNYTTRQLHGIFEASSFGGSNIDPTAWEDKKCRGESRYPAQVRIRVRNPCKPLQEEAFRPILHHYDGPKFWFQLAVQILDLFNGGRP